MDLVHMVKVLLVGDVEANWDAVCARAEKLTKSSHGPFDMMLCVGYCGLIPDSYRSGAVEPPIPTYFISANGLSESVNHPKFRYLGPYGVEKVSSPPDL